MKSFEDVPQPPAESEPEVINENESLGIRAKVVLDKSREERGYIRAEEGQEFAGFVFYEVGEDGKLSDEPIHMDITDKPELVVNTDEAYENYLNKRIIAKRTVFTRSKDDKWSVEIQ